MMYFANLLIYLFKDLKAAAVFLPAGIAAFLAVILAYRLVLHDKKGQAHFKRGVAVSAAMAYVVVILFVTFFSREAGSRDGLDLLPFATVGNGPQGDAYVLENVLLFIPLGILLPCTDAFWQRFPRCIVMGFSISIMTELSQFLTQRGHAQTDDVITNTLGTMIGYMMFRWIQGLYKKYLKKNENSA